ncbi:uncharacterized protein SCHCODRAFT_02665151 [Schizophyllum commune H4-8]|nr:uncharacterized protein SCHCODRAFT_02665151 [Schizophyllum commune H4-8]KAI5894674.1 hypothetical protein SCHCODRAFT_02665151 [Schizophyllum commune H4-8]
MSGNHHITLCTNCGHSVSIDLSLAPEEEVLQAIRDGHIPSESSCRAHNAAADAVQSKIDELERLIERLQTLTEEVEEHRDRLIEYSALWRLLFDLYQPSSGRRSRSSDRDMLTALSLGLVCQRWRAIARRDTRLWAPYLRFNVCALMFDSDLAAKILGDEVRDFRAVVACYLERSRIEPLRLHIMWRGLKEMPQELQAFSEDAHHLLRNVFAHFWRWRKCTIAADVLEYMLEHEPRIRVPSSLEYCSVIDPKGSHRRIVPLFADAPRLTRWSHSGRGLYEPNLPFSQITYFDAEWTSVEYLGQILRSCKALEYLDVYVAAGSDSHLSDFPSRASLPHLKVLALKRASSSLVHTVLCLLSAPILEYLMLDLRFGQPWRESLAAESYSLLERTSGKISLSISMTLSGDRLREFLRHPRIGSVNGYMLTFSFGTTCTDADGAGCGDRN